jgi:prepilin-type N-terminal cleavage/methylation domain-containing protein
MRISSPRAPKTAALTLIELLIVLAVIAVLAAIILPGLNERVGRRSARINCANCLKQIGLSFKTWALDNQDNYPMHDSVTNGGTLELIGQDAMFTHYLVMSNELSTHKILICPNDSKRTSATNFGLGFNNLAIGYFVGVDAVETNSTMILAGDRNLTNGSTAAHGILRLPPDKPLGWTAEIHNCQGNLLFSDGSVQQVTTLRLRDEIQTSRPITNRLEFP